jgi:site-specific recombinase XerD
MMKYGVPDKVSGKMLGHNDERTTRIYQHAQEEMERTAANAMETSYNKAKSLTRL